MRIDSCAMTELPDSSSQAAGPGDDLLERAIRCHQAWEYEEAEALYRAVLAQLPGHADANHNLGVLLAIQLLRPLDALPYFEASLNADGGNPQYWFSYLDALIRSEQRELARNLLPLAQSMGLPMAMVNALSERIEVNAAPAQQALSPAARPAPAPSAPEAPPQPADKKVKVRRRQEIPESGQVDLVNCFRRRELRKGETLARELLEQYPDSGFAWKALGAFLHTQGKLDEALVAKRKSAQLLPQDPEVQCNLGHLLQEVGEFEAGLVALNRALKLKPNYPEAYNNLGITYQRLGDVERALMNFMRALELDPDNRIDYSNYLFTLNYHPDLSAEAVYAGYVEFDRRFCEPLRSHWRPHDNPPLAGRRLKVGYVSPDFRNHSTRNFMEPLLSGHDHAVVEVYAYADLGREDEVTHAYKGFVDHWVLVNGMSDEALAERIRADGIDVLVDLAGHSTGNRLGVFARKPAPVSVSWMGYGYTTGLKAIDYFLTDEVIVPKDAEHLFSEVPWRLEGFSCAYRARTDTGEVNALPALQRGYVTFGTLTRAIRINHRTIRVWSEILKRVPGAKLVIDSGSYKDEGVREALLQKFEAQGVARSRLEVGFHSPPWDVLRGMDIGLDCFPHNSGTTLFESLYLGVPYITLADRPSVGRLGSSILHGVGHPEWVAQSEDDYIDKAVALAADLPALAQVRAALRPQMQASPVMDEAAFARRVEQAYGQMFQRWRDSGQAVEPGTMSLEDELRQLVALFQRGDFREGETRALALVQQHPQHGSGWKLLGAFRQKQGDLKGALQAKQAAAALLPDDMDAQFNLGLSYEKLGFWQEAESCFRRLEQHDATDVEVLNNLGNALWKQHKLQEAAVYYRRAIALQPDLAEAYLNLGYLLGEVGDRVEEETHWRRAIQALPNQVEAYRGLGKVLVRLGRMEEAETAYRSALKNKDEDHDFHFQLALAMSEMGRHDEAIAAYKKALEFKPDLQEALNNLSLVLQDRAHQDDAELHARRALALAPQNPVFLGTLARTLQLQGRIEESLGYYRQALANSRDALGTYGNYLFVLNYDPDLNAEAIYRAYEEYDQRYGQPLRHTWRAHDNPPAAGRRLKVGYVSPDFKNHSVQFFVEPLLANHDRASVEVYAYADLPREDHLSRRYKSYVDHWVLTNGMSDEALAERIRADGIDVLVDLAGHTAGNRLGAFARKPAPVSVSWMGFGYTTGLKAIDYFLTDEPSSPVGSEHLFAETPWRVPQGSYAYRPRGDMGEVNALPALERGHVTFGTLTRAIRINHRTIRVWSEILKRVPGAKLVIDSSSYKDEGVREALLQKFEAQGVTREQLEVGFHSPPWDVLRGMDIGLDCFPHNSGTTLFESLYLGVPYITLAGRPSVGRLGSSVLHGVGHPEWIAASEEEYIQKAVALASDLGQLAQIRAQLRPQMQASAMMNETAFARRIEQAYSQMFQKWEMSKQ